MDMKRILQAVDGIATKPVEGVDSMSKFLRTVKEADVSQPVPAVAPASTLSPEQIAYNQLRAQLDSADSLRGGSNTYTDVSPEVTASTNAMRTKLAQMAAGLKAKGIDAAAEYDAPDTAVPTAAPVNLSQKYNDQPVSEDIGMSRMLSIVTEGANPHKVALPVQMAMQHYSKPTVTEKRIPKETLIGKYFQAVEEDINKEKESRRALINQYASTIAERVMMKESGEAGWNRTGMAGVGVMSNAPDGGHLTLGEMPIEPSGDPNDPTVYGHEKANPMSLKGRIMSARAQLKELAQMAESNDLATWQQITKLHKGGMFMGLAQNLEQISHGINELAAKRRKGGTASRGIDKNIDERSVSQAQARLMAAAAHNPEFAKKVKMKPSVAKDFNQADKGKNIKALPKRVPKK